MKVVIKSVKNGETLYEIEANSVLAATEMAINSGADLSDANLSGADLSGADLRYADLRGADLRGVNGLAKKEDEMKKAAEMIAMIKKSGGTIGMKTWHTCETAHCLAGWCCPEERYPVIKATLMIPTVSKYFYNLELSHDDAMAVLERVASGEESIYNNQK